MVGSDKVKTMIKRKFPSLSSLGSDGNTSFLRAARAGHLDKVLEQLRNNVDINTSNANGLNALHLASKDGHVHVVTELLKRGASVDSATKKGNTALHIASLAGQEEVVRLLVEHGASVNVQSQNGFTPLYMAAQENHDNVVRYLLANGANQSLATEDGFTPLAVAMQQGHDKVVAVLLENDTRGKVRLPALHIAAKKDDTKAAALLLQNEHNPDVTSKSGFTPLHIASHYGNEGIANLLLGKGADVNYSAKHNITPLHVAAKWGKSNMVSLLLEKGANIESKTRDGLTPLHCAARSGHEQVVDMLLERGAPISSKTKNGLAPLHMSSQGDHVDAARILLYHRAPVDEVTVDYLTALHVAAHCGHARVAKLLLDRKADPNARALNGFTPLHIACKKNRIKVVELLLKHGASIEATTESGLTPLHVASFMGCMNIVIYLLQNEANPDVPTVRGETPLHLAARANQTDIIRILLRNGAQVDARAREQQTPLHIAARLGNVDIVMLLLQHGAQVDCTTKDLYSALHIAAKEGQDEVASVLLENGASPTATTKKGFTPLHLAAKYGNMKVARLLLQRDAPVDAQGKNGVTPLHVASHYDHQNVALLLLDKGASPHATAKNGHTPLHIAAKKNQMDIATTLLEYGAKANAESKAGFTPLHLSSQEGHIDMSSLLIDHHADTNHKAKNGLTPLHLCAQEDRVNVASVLVKNGAEVDSTTKAGYTPLHVACHFGQLNMVKFLLDEGSGVSASTAVGYTPLHQAAQQGHCAIVNTLLERGAPPNATTNQGQTAMSIAQKLGYISVVESLKGVTETTITPSGDEKYKVVSPETMQETFMSDSEDEGGEDTLLSEQPYRYLTVDEMKSLGDDSLPIDVRQDERVDSNRECMTVPPTAVDDTVSPQHLKEAYSQFTTPDNIDISRHPLHVGFLVSFLVDARGGAMRGCRHSGVRVIVPPRRASMPMRVTCRYLKRDKLSHPPPLMEGEALASRILELGPVGAKFLGPVMIEVPHFGSLRGKEREIVILRSDNGETWREHTVDCSEEAVQDVLSHSFDKEEMSQLEENSRTTRILTTDFPHYFAVVTRVRQEVHAIGPEGGMVSSSVVPQVQAVFPQGALTKKIKVGLQAQPIPAELAAKLLGNRVAVSPIVTVEPRRRKFHKPITLTIPKPQAANKGMINNYSGDAPTLRLLCSITGGTTRAQWEDVTGSTPFTFVNDCVSFTTTVSARFWLMDCRNVGDATKMATELYREAIHVPFMAKFVVFAKRVDPLEARLRIFCMTDDKEDKTLEHQEHFTEVAKSRDVEVLEGKTQYVEFAGNLVPVTKSGEQLQLGFRAFRENRLPFTVRVKDPHADCVGRTLFMREARLPKGEPPQQPICVLNIVLPDEIIPEAILTEHELHKYSFIQDSSGLESYQRVDLRLSDISNLLGGDWVPLAEELGVAPSHINRLQSEQPHSVAQQGLAMLRLWVSQAGNKAQASTLESALSKIGRDDIVQQCVFNVDQSGLQLLKDESRDASLRRSIPYSDKDIMKDSESIEDLSRTPLRKTGHITEKDDKEERKYEAEEKEVEEVKKSVSDRRKEIEKRLSMERPIENQTDKERASIERGEDSSEKEIAEEKRVSSPEEEPSEMSFHQKRLSFEQGKRVIEMKPDKTTMKEVKDRAADEKFIAEERKAAEKIKDTNVSVDETSITFKEKRKSFEQGSKDDKSKPEKEKDKKDEKKREDLRRDSELFEGVSQGLGRLDVAFTATPQVQDLLSPKVAKTPPPSPAEFKDITGTVAWTEEPAAESPAKIHQSQDWAEKGKPDSTVDPLSKGGSKVGEKNGTVTESKKDKSNISVTSKYPQKTNEVIEIETSQLITDKTMEKDSKYQFTMSVPNKETFTEMSNSITNFLEAEKQYNNQTIMVKPDRLSALVDAEVTSSDETEESQSKSESEPKSDKSFMGKMSKKLFGVFKKDDKEKPDKKKGKKKKSKKGKIEPATISVEETKVAAGSQNEISTEKVGELRKEQLVIGKKSVDNTLKGSTNVSEKTVDASKIPKGDINQDELVDKAEENDKEMSILPKEANFKSKEEIYSTDDKSTKDYLEFQKQDDTNEAVQRIEVCKLKDLEVFTSADETEKELKNESNILTKDTTSIIMDERKEDLLPSEIHTASLQNADKKPPSADEILNETLIEIKKHVKDFKGKEVSNDIIISSVEKTKDIIDSGNKEVMDASKTSTEKLKETKEKGKSFFSGLFSRSSEAVVDSKVETEDVSLANSEKIKEAKEELSTASDNIIVDQTTNVVDPCDKLGKAAKIIHETTSVVVEEETNKVVHTKTETFKMLKETTNTTDKFFRDISSKIESETEMSTNVADTKGQTTITKHEKKEQTYKLPNERDTKLSRPVTIIDEKTKEKTLLCDVFSDSSESSEKVKTKIKENTNTSETTDIATENVTVQSLNNEKFDLVKGNETTTKTEFNQRPTESVGGEDDAISVYPTNTGKEIKYTVKELEENKSKQTEESAVIIGTNIVNETIVLAENQSKDAKTKLNETSQKARENIKSGKDKSKSFFSGIFSKTSGIESDPKRKYSDESVHKIVDTNKNKEVTLLEEKVYEPKTNVVADNSNIGKVEQTAGGQISVPELPKTVHEPTVDTKNKFVSFSEDVKSIQAEELKLKINDTPKYIEKDEKDSITFEPRVTTDTTKTTIEEDKMKSPDDIKIVEKSKKSKEKGKSFFSSIFSKTSENVETAKDTVNEKVAVTSEIVIGVKDEVILATENVKSKGEELIDKGKSKVEEYTQTKSETAEKERDATISAVTELPGKIQTITDRVNEDFVITTTTISNEVNFLPGKDQKTDKRIEEKFDVGSIPVHKGQSYVGHIEHKGMPNLDEIVNKSQEIKDDVQQKMKDSGTSIQEKFDVAKDKAVCHSKGVIEKTESLLHDGKTTVVESASSSFGSIKHSRDKSVTFAVDVIDKTSEEIKDNKNNIFDSLQCIVEKTKDNVDMAATSAGSSVIQVNKYIAEKATDGNKKIENVSSNMGTFSDDITEKCVGLSLKTENVVDNTLGNVNEHTSAVYKTIEGTKDKSAAFMENVITITKETVNEGKSQVESEIKDADSTTHTIKEKANKDNDENPYVVGNTTTIHKLPADITIKLEEKVNKGKTKVIETLKSVSEKAAEGKSCVQSLSERVLDLTKDKQNETSLAAEKIAENIKDSVECTIKKVVDKSENISKHGQDTIVLAIDTTKDNVKETSSSIVECIPSLTKEPVFKGSLSSEIGLLTEKPNEVIHVNLKTMKTDIKTSAENMGKEVKEATELCAIKTGDTVKNIATQGKQSVVNVTVTGQEKIKEKLSAVDESVAGYGKIAKEADKTVISEGLLPLKNVLEGFKDETKTSLDKIVISTENLPKMDTSADQLKSSIGSVIETAKDTVDKGKAMIYDNILSEQKDTEVITNKTKITTTNITISAEKSAKDKGSTEVHSKHVVNKTDCEATQGKKPVVEAMDPPKESASTFVANAPSLVMETVNKGIAAVPESVQSKEKNSDGTKSKITLMTTSPITSAQKVTTDIKDATKQNIDKAVDESKNLIKQAVIGVVHITKPSEMEKASNLVDPVSSTLKESVDTGKLLFSESSLSGEKTIQDTVIKTMDSNSGKVHVSPQNAKPPVLPSQPNQNRSSRNDDELDNILIDMLIEQECMKSPSSDNLKQHSLQASQPLSKEAPNLTEKHDTEISEKVSKGDKPLSFKNIASYGEIESLMHESDSKKKQENYMTDTSSSYVTTPTLRRRKIGGSQRLSREEQPTLREIQHIIDYSSSDEDEPNKYIVTEPIDQPSQRNVTFHVESEDEAYLKASDSSSEPEIEVTEMTPSPDPSSKREKTVPVQESNVYTADSQSKTKHDKNVQKVERRFERMASEALEADPSVKFTTDREFQRMVSQLSSEEVDACITQWDEGGLTPSEELDSTKDTVEGDLDPEVEALPEAFLASTNPFYSSTTQWVDFEHDISDVPSSMFWAFNTTPSTAIIQPNELDIPIHPIPVKGESAGEDTQRSPAASSTRESEEALLDLAAGVQDIKGSGAGPSAK